MADHPGCECGHPEAAPDWIDHNAGCIYLADVEKANTLLAKVHAIIGPEQPRTKPRRTPDITPMVRRDLVQWIASMRA